MDASTVVAASATVIAVASLAVSASELRANRRHNRLSMRPLLQLHHRWKVGERSGLILVNYGVGPAAVVRTCLSLDGETLGEFDHTNALRLTDRLDFPVEISTVDGPRFLAAQYESFLLSVESFDSASHSPLRDVIRERLRVEIHYESLYGGEGYLATFPR